MTQIDKVKSVKYQLEDVFEYPDSVEICCSEDYYLKVDTKKDLPEEIEGVKIKKKVIGV